MAFNIGLSVIEVDGTGSPAIVNAPTSVGAFNILTKRGVPNRATPVTSFPQFAEQFGGYFAGGLGAYMVKGFFDNGGQTAYINRVVATDAATGAAPGTLTLADTANNTLRLDAGFRGLPDPGVWGNDLWAAVVADPQAGVRPKETAPATVTGTVLTATINMSAFPSLAVLVDGETTPTTLTFKAADFPAGAAAATAAQDEPRRLPRFDSRLGDEPSSDPPRSTLSSDRAHRPSPDMREPFRYPNRVVGPDGVADASTTLSSRST